MNAVHLNYERVINPNTSIVCVIIAYDGQFPYNSSPTDPYLLQLRVNTLSLNHTVKNMATHQAFHYLSAALSPPDDSSIQPSAAATDSSHNPPQEEIEASASPPAQKALEVVSSLSRGSSGERHPLSIPEAAGYSR